MDKLTQPPSEHGTLLGVNEGGTVDVFSGGCERLPSGDSVLMDARSGLLLEKLPRPEVEELVLEEVPDISYNDIGGLDDQIEQITDAVELPFLHQELFAEHKPPSTLGATRCPGCGSCCTAASPYCSVGARSPRR